MKKLFLILILMVPTISFAAKSLIPEYNPGQTFLDEQQRHPLYQEAQKLKKILSEYKPRWAYNELTKELKFCLQKEDMEIICTMFPYEIRIEDPEFVPLLEGGATF